MYFRDKDSDGPSSDSCLCRLGWPYHMGNNRSTTTTLTPSNSVGRVGVSGGRVVQHQTTSESLRSDCAEPACSVDERPTKPVSIHT
jgi:hypothetical protein